MDGGGEEVGESIAERDREGHERSGEEEVGDPLTPHGGNDGRRRAFVRREDPPVGGDRVDDAARAERHAMDGQRVATRIKQGGAGDSAPCRHMRAVKVEDVVGRDAEAPTCAPYALRRGPARP